MEKHKLAFFFKQKTQGPQIKLFCPLALQKCVTGSVLVNLLHPLHLWCGSFVVQKIKPLKSATLKNADVSQIRGFLTASK